MTWPEAFVYAVGIIAAVVGVCAFFWMMTRIGGGESTTDAILRRNAEPMHFEYRRETREYPKPAKWIVKRKHVPAKKATKPVPDDEEGSDAA